MRLVQFFFFFLEIPSTSLARTSFSNIKTLMVSICLHFQLMQIIYCCTQFLTACNSTHKLLLKTCKACVLVLQGEFDCIV